MLESDLAPGRPATPSLSVANATNRRGLTAGAGQVHAPHGCAEPIPCPFSRHGCKVTKSQLTGLAVLLISLAALAGCVGRDQQPTRTPPPPTATPLLPPTPSPTPEPKRLTICLQEEPDSLYLYGTESLAAEHVWQALYDGPVDTIDYDYQPVILSGMPKLRDRARVETVTVRQGDRVLSAGGSVMGIGPGVMVYDAEGERTIFRGEPVEMERMVVTFTLRSDIRWSDGEPLTADDSVYSFELAADPATPLDKQIVERTADYRATGDDQVVWESVPGFLDRGYKESFWHPLPRHAWGQLSAGELLTAEVSSRMPLGWGPFMMGAWVAGDSMILRRNPQYFRAAEGLPRIDELTYRFVADAKELEQHLRAGTCHVVTHEAAAVWSVDAARSSPEVTGLVSEDDAWEVLAFGITPALDYERPDFFEDVRVRQAIAQCVDREGVAKDVLPGDGQVPHSYVPPGHPAYAANAVTTWPHRPDAGQLLLAQVGWRDEDGDGVREAHGIPGIQDGTAFRVTYKTTASPSRSSTAARVAADLRACGIDATVETMPAEELFAPGPDGALFGRRFDLAQFAWPVRTVPLCDTFVSSQIPQPGDWVRPNAVGFIDDAYDTACQQTLTVLPGRGSYAAVQAQAQQLFSERLPVLPLFVRQKVVLARAGVTGLTPNASEASGLWNVEVIDLGVGSKE